MFRRRPKPQHKVQRKPDRLVGRSWLADEPRESDIHVVYVQSLDTGQQWRSLKTNRVFEVSFADALFVAEPGDRAYLRYRGPTEVAFVRDPHFDYGR